MRMAGASQLGGERSKGRERILAVEDAPWRFFVSLSVGEINQSTKRWPLFFGKFFGGRENPGTRGWESMDERKIWYAEMAAKSDGEGNAQSLRNEWCQS